MSQEKLQILNMVKDGKISVDEGLKLIEALEENNEKFDNRGSKVGKCLRVRVFDPEDETKVNVTLPVSLLKVGMKFASKLSPELSEANLNELDIEEILAAVDSGQIGKIVEVDSSDGTKVEITIE
ncbi:MAG: hypothetical protein RIN55_03060 [Tissierellaceae bacterium]|nr:hypothetical protein [Tissierellaceae bacterium]